VFNLDLVFYKFNETASMKFKFLSTLGFLILINLTCSGQVSLTHDRNLKYRIPKSPDTETFDKVGLFTHYEKTAPHCRVEPSSKPAKIAFYKRDLSKIKYKSIFLDFSIEDYIKRYDVMGLVIAHNGNIVTSYYQFERTADDQFTSMSVAKSFISILIGIALDEGLIASLDDEAGKYTKRINASGYSSVSIRNLLRMSAGLNYSEIYGKISDSSKFFNDTLLSNSSSVINALNNFTRKPSGSGQSFNYAGTNTATLAEVIRGATGKSICTYMQEKIWGPIGASDYATWITDSEGNELGYAFLNATQRDYLKFGMMIANKGVFNGERIVSESYLDEATNIEIQPKGFRVGDVNMLSGYGYQFWLQQQKGRIWAIGTNGQFIGIDQSTNTVLVINSANHLYSDQIRFLGTFRLFDSIVNELAAR